MARGWRDFTVPVTVEAVTVESLPIDVKAQTLGTLKVDVASQTLGQLNVNIAASAVTLNVNIAAQAVDINVKTSGGANIVIDKLTQDACAERRAMVSNDNGISGTAVPPGSLTGTAFRGKFFPRGMRGFLTFLFAYCQRSATGSLTLAFSPQPGMGEVGSVTLTPDANWGWRYTAVNRFWNYDSLFVWVKACSADVSVGYDIDSPSDGWSSSDAGASWISEPRRYFFRVAVSAMTVGDLPVSGTVNTVEVPAVSSVLNSGTVRVNGTETKTLISITGAGRVEGLMHNVWVAAGSPDAQNDNMQFVVDGVLTEINLAYLARTLNYRRDTVSPFSLVEFDDAAMEWGVALNKPIHFKRSFEFRVYNNAVAGYDFHARAVALATLLR